MKDPDPVPEGVRSRLEHIIDTPELFLRDVDPVGHRAVLTPMTEDSYRASSFLDTRIQRAGNRDLAIPLDTLRKLITIGPLKIVDRHPDLGEVKGIDLVLIVGLLRA